MFSINGLREAFATLIIVGIIIYFIYAVGNIVYHLGLDYEMKNNDNDKMDRER